MAKATYKVLSNVDHDGDRYESGESIELEDKQAKPLLDVGAIQASETKPKQTPAK